jgi:hypothetical protein
MTDIIVALIGAAATIIAALIVAKIIGKDSGRRGFVVFIKSLFDFTSDKRKTVLPALYCLIFVIIFYLLATSWETIDDFFNDPWFSIPSLSVILITLGYYEIKWIKKSMKQWRHILMLLLLIVVVFTFYRIVSGYVGGYRPQYFSSEIKMKWVAGIPSSDSKLKSDGGILGQQFLSPQGLEIDRGRPNDPKLYVADWEAHRIFSIENFDSLNPKEITISRIAGSEAGYADGPMAESKFHSPSDLALDPTGRFLYVADYGNGAIRRIDLEKELVRTVMNYECDYCIEEEMDTLDEVFDLSTCMEEIEDYSDDTIIHCDDLTVLYEPAPQYIRDQKILKKMTMSAPTGLSLINDGEKQILFIADEGYHAVHRIVFSGPYLTDAKDMEQTVTIASFRTILGHGISGWSDDSYTESRGDLSARHARLQLPADVYAVCEVDSSGNTAARKLYIVDTWNNAIRLVSYDEDGNIPDDNRLEIFAGNGEKGFSDGDRIDAKFNKPGDIVQVDDGTFIIADTENDMIRILTGDRVRTLVGIGTPGISIPDKDYAPEDSSDIRIRGLGPKNPLNSPWGLVIYKNKLVFTDAGNHIIRYIDIPLN